MNLAQLIVYKHREQQSFVCFFNTKAQSAHTCVAVLTPGADNLAVKYFMTLCMFELFPFFSSNFLFFLNHDFCQS